MKKCRLLVASVALSVGALSPGARAQCETDMIDGPWLRFGSDVSVSGDRFLVVSDDFFLSVVSIVELVGGRWVETPIDFGGSPTFRAGGELSGSCLLFFSGDGSEEVQVFEEVGGAWQSAPPLVALDGAAFDDFGVALALSETPAAGRVAVVGAPQNDGLTPDAGAAYVFEYVGGAWQQAAKLRGDEVDPSARFGCRVAVHGETILVEAEDEQPAGALYVFERIAGVWTRTDRLSHADGRFRGPLAIDGDRFLVGHEESDVVAADAGAVYVHEKVGALWPEVARLSVSDGEAGDRLGRTVSLSGDVAVVGTGSSFSYGSAYVFRFDGSGWVQGVELTGSAQGEFGAIDHEGDLLVVGNPDWSRVFVDSLGDACGPGTASCFGVGCPCGNDDPGAGCANSTGSGALLDGSGTPSVATDDLVLSATGCPPNNSGLFYMGDTQVLNPFFDGLQCALGTTWRFLGSIQSTGAGGTLTLGPGIAADSGGLLVPGTTWHFHAWHRDAAAGASPCGTGANLSNLYTVTATP